LNRWNSLCMILREGKVEIGNPPLLASEVQGVDA